MKTSEQNSADALKFLKAHIGGVLATLSPEKTPCASFVYYIVNDDFSIYIATFGESRKYNNILADNHVAFTVAAAEVPQTVQLEGTVEEIIATDEVTKATVGLIKIFTSNKKYYSPQAKLAADWENMKVLKIVPTWIRWGDFTSGMGLDAFHYVRE